MPRDEPVDPGAAVVVESIRAAITSTGPPRDEGYVIELRRVRNLSIARESEFAAFRKRLAALLSEAGSHGPAPDLRFVDGREEPADYQMHGSAYLLTASGFDQWELFLNLRPEGQRWELWRTAGALRVLRQPRPGQQVFPAR